MKVITCIGIRPTATLCLFPDRSECTAAFFGMALAQWIEDQGPAASLRSSGIIICHELPSGQ